MKRGTVKVITLAAAPLCALALAAPAAATSSVAAHAAGAFRGAAARAAVHPASSALAGYYEYNGSEGTAYDSTGGNVTATNSTAGHFIVTFAGLAGAASGNFQVTPQQNEDTCDIGDWGAFGSDLGVLVDCWDLNGNPSNVEFSLLVTMAKTAPHGILAYDTDVKPTSSYTMTGQYQYNSTRHKNRVTHLGTGRYKVVMPVGAKATATGTVKVSPYDSQPGSCQLQSWSDTRGSIVSYVNCYNAAGVRQDRIFGIVYARNTNLMGQNGLTDANASASKANVSFYPPSVQYDSHAGARVHSVLIRTGQYVLFFVGSRGHAGNPNGGGGNVQVTPVNKHYTHCTLENSWSQGVTPYAVVYCRNNNDQPVDSAFTVQWVTR